MVEAKIKRTLNSPQGEFILNLDLKVGQGELLTIFGPSGSGKTTLLRILAGLDNPDSGFIKVEDSIWADSESRFILKPNKRSVGLVFQDYALFPNMTVKENIEFGVNNKSDNSLVDDIIDLMELSSLLERKPVTLSGGQSQRVALARTMATKPKLLLLDEPLAALDIDMRQSIQDFLLEAHKRYEFTTILVSHDVGEIFKLSDRVIKLEDGHETQSGTPYEVFFKKGASGRFQFTGEIIDISLEDVVYVITVLIGQQIVKVIAEESVALDLAIGDKVLVTSKAFNPIIQKAL